MLGDQGCQGVAANVSGDTSAAVKLEMYIFHAAK